jgi:hypothetical protein
MKSWKKIYQANGPWKQAGCEAHGIPTATPEINQHSPLDSLTPALGKKNWIINKEQKRTHSREGGMFWAHQRREEGQGAPLRMNFQ